ncbi:hypothetical protein JCM9279_004326 [Rhodotorula babjevae]
MSAAAELPAELLKAVGQALARSKARVVSSLSHDLAGVWFRLRTAVLVDSCLLSEKEARTLAKALESTRPSLFVLHEPVSGQTLVVNRDLLEDRLREQVPLVDVGGREPLVLSIPPPSLAALLASLSSSSPTSFLSLDLPDPDRPQNLVPLVGILLDYAVAYSLGDSDGRNCLGGRDLVVVEAALVNEGGGRQRLLSFSYPSSLSTDDPALEPLSVVRLLQLKLDARLSTARAQHRELERVWIEVDSRAVVLDQVAL